MASVSNSLSKMNKKELYEKCKLLQHDMMKYQQINYQLNEDIHKVQIENDNIEKEYKDTLMDLKETLIERSKERDEHIKLQEENEKLKAQVGEHTEKYGGTMVFPSVHYQLEQENKKLIDEIKKLKEDNKWQKKHIEKLKNNFGIKTEDFERHITYLEKTIIPKLKEDNKQYAIALKENMEKAPVVLTPELEQEHKRIKNQLLETLKKSNEYRIQLENLRTCETNN